MISFLFKTFLCKATSKPRFFIYLYLRAFKLFSFISFCSKKFFSFIFFCSKTYNMDDQEDYEEDLLSDIFPLRETSGRKKSHVWDYYESHGIKNMDMSAVFVEPAGGSGRWEKCARW